LIKKEYYHINIFLYFELIGLSINREKLIKRFVLTLLKLKFKDFFNKKRGFFGLLIKLFLFLSILIFEIYIVVAGEKNLAIGVSALNFITYRINLVYPIKFIISKIDVLIYLLFFSLLARKKLLDMKDYKFRPKTSLIFIAISFFFVMLLRGIRLKVISNPSLIYNYHWTFLFLKYFLPIALAVSLFIAIFDFPLISLLWKELKFELGISFLFSFIFIHFADFLKDNWRFFTFLIRVIVSFIMKSIGFESSYILKPPILTVENISLTMWRPCSGIESLTLFAFLFSIVLFVEWDKINKLRASILFVPGMIGMFFTNVFRVFLLYLVGVFFGTEAAVGAFHSNIGWVLFSLYFLMFLFLSYNWIRDKK
jgi:exosortase/archaeosortase family protein